MGQRTVEMVCKSVIFLLSLAYLDIKEVSNAENCSSDSGRNLQEY